MKPLEPSLGFEVESSSGFFNAKTTSGAHHTQSMFTPRVCSCTSVCTNVEYGSCNCAESARLCA